MDFKKLAQFFFTGLTSYFFLTACNNVDKNNIDNTFYVELINFTKDSLKQKVSENIYGKVAYYKNKELKIISLNYITDDYSDMHYFKQMNELDKNIKENTKKIRVEFKEPYTADSISYSLQKFKFTNNTWKKYSDMGFVKTANTFFGARKVAINEFGKKITNNIVLYSYN